MKGFSTRLSTLQERRTARFPHGPEWAWYPPGRGRALWRTHSLQLWERRQTILARAPRLRAFQNKMEAVRRLVIQWMRHLVESGSPLAAHWRMKGIVHAHDKGQDPPNTHAPGAPCVPAHGDHA